MMNPMTMMMNGMWNPYYMMGGHYNPMYGLMNPYIDQKDEDKLGDVEAVERDDNAEN